MALGRKTATDAVKEELVEEVVDQALSWIERGGLRRLWTVIKVMVFSIVALIIVLLVYLFEYAQ